MYTITETQVALQKLVEGSLSLEDSEAVADCIAALKHLTPKEQTQLLMAAIGYGAVPTEVLKNLNQEMNHADRTPRPDVQRQDQPRTRTRTLTRVYSGELHGLPQGSGRKRTLATSGSTTTVRTIKADKAKYRSFLQAPGNPG